MLYHFCPNNAFKCQDHFSNLLSQTFEINFFKDTATQMNTEEIDGNNTPIDSTMEPQPHKQTPGELLLYSILLSALHQ